MRWFIISILFVGFGFELFGICFVDFIMCLIWFLGWSFVLFVWELVLGFNDWVRVCYFRFGVYAVDCYLLWGLLYCRSLGFGWVLRFVVWFFGCAFWFAVGDAWFLIVFCFMVWFGKFLFCCLLLLVFYWLWLVISWFDLFCYDLAVCVFDCWFVWFCLSKLLSVLFCRFGVVYWILTCLRCCGLLL